jgi:thioredoxin reductase
MNPSLPVVVIGAGPVGLAAAAHALSRGLTPMIFEAGAGIGAGIRRWGHVRLFSPWKFNVDNTCVALLREHGWSMPDGDACPTGAELVEQYLEPLVTLTPLKSTVRLGTRVLHVTREHHDVLKDGRGDAPFLVRVSGAQGEEDVLAQAVVDASGTIDTPGSLGSSGIPAIGERASSERIFYGIPDVLNTLRDRYANRRVLVVGSGHSALNALLDLARLAADEPGTTIVWAIRRPELGQLLGGTRPDQLEERGRLGSQVRTLLTSGRLTLVTGFRITRIVKESGGLVVIGDGDRTVGPVDEIIAATGFRPDWSILSELRLDLDPAVQSTRALAPLIDPNIHSCGTVRPHGAEELQQPERNLFVIGMKSYGRAPTFLMLTGYEQARSVISAIAGDWEAARRVELVLPETGVCSTDAAAGGCCGTDASGDMPAPIPVAPRAGKRLATLHASQGSCC